MLHPLAASHIASMNARKRLRRSNDALVADYDRRHDTFLVRDDRPQNVDDGTGRCPLPNTGEWFEKAGAAQLPGIGASVFAWQGQSASLSWQSWHSRAKANARRLRKA